MRIFLIIPLIVFFTACEGRTAWATMYNVKITQNLPDAAESEAVCNDEGGVCFLTLQTPKGPIDVAMEFAPGNAYFRFMYQREALPMGGTDYLHIPLGKKGSDPRTVKIFEKPPPNYDDGIRRSLVLKSSGSVLTEVGIIIRSDQ